MKIGAVIFLLISLATGCQQTDPSIAPDSLYQRWRLVRVQYANNNRTIDVQNADWAITEFRLNGTITYGANGRLTTCCSPNRFKREGAKLDLVNVSSIPVPETDKLDNCATVSCLSSGNAWQILLLTPESLLLKTGYGINTYQSYP